MVMLDLGRVGQRVQRIQISLEWSPEVTDLLGLELAGPFAGLVPLGFVLGVQLWLVADGDYTIEPVLPFPEFRPNFRVSRRAAI